MPLTKQGDAAAGADYAKRIKKEAQEEIDRGNIKIWKVRDKSNAGIMLSDDTAFIAGDKRTFMVAGQGSIAIVANSIGFGTMSENTRWGGLWVKQNDIVQMIPFTLMTPMPNNVPFPPLGIPLGVARDLPFFMAMLA